MDPQRCRLCAQAGPSDRRGCADPRVLRCRCRAGAAAHRGDGDEPRVEPVAHYIALRDGGQEQSGLRAAHLHPRLSGSGGVGARKAAGQGGSQPLHGGLLHQQVPAHPRHVHPRAVQGGGGRQQGPRALSRLQIDPPPAARPGGCAPPSTPTIQPFKANTFICFKSQV
eukprot:1189627-Prorocentrum_minimum.AAC.2